MRNVFARLLAVVVLFGQLQQLPALVACTLRHEEHSKVSCGDTSANGASVAAVQSPGVGLCATSTCALPSSVAVPITTAAGFVGAIVDSGAAGVPARPFGYNTPPLVPPPQA